MKKKIASHAQTSKSSSTIFAPEAETAVEDFDAMGDEGAAAAAAETAGEFDEAMREAK